MVVAVRPHISSPFAQSILMEWRICSKRLQENLILVYLGIIEVHLWLHVKYALLLINMAQSTNYPNLTHIKGVPYRISTKCLERFLGYVDMSIYDLI
jgi:hypothetical protein